MRKLRDLLVINQKPVTAPVCVLDYAFVRVASEKQSPSTRQKNWSWTRGKNGTDSSNLAVYTDNNLSRVGQKVEVE